MLQRDAWQRLVAAALITASLSGCGGSEQAEQRSGAWAPSPEAHGTSGGEAANFAPTPASDSIALEEQLAAAPAVSSEGPTLELDGGVAAAPPPPPSPRELTGAKAESPGVPQTQPATPASNPSDRDPERTPAHHLSLIYDARVHLAVFETAQAIDAAERLARDSGGYLVRRDDRSISFRVPGERFYPTLEAAMKLGDVLHREVTVRDVTEEFRDLRVRLRSAEAVRDRLEQLLARAQKVDEALQVERELERVAREIEQIKGRLAMLQELTAFSTVTLLFQPRPIDQVGSEVRLPFPWLNELGLSGLLQL